MDIMVIYLRTCSKDLINGISKSTIIKPFKPNNIPIVDFENPHSVCQYKGTLANSWKNAVAHIATRIIKVRYSESL